MNIAEWEMVKEMETKSVVLVWFELSFYSRSWSEHNLNVNFTREEI